MQAPVAFVNLDSINVTPYFAYYESACKRPYDLIYWDRGGSDIATNANATYQFRSHVGKKNNAAWLLDLARGYRGFRAFATNILKRNDYDMIVALTGNRAVLLSGILHTKYRNRFIMDIRDYFLENVPPYRKREKR